MKKLSLETAMNTFNSVIDKHNHSDMCNCKPYIRNDGLPIWEDKKDDELNAIRRYAHDKKVVILAVALRRAQQIAINYANKHAPEVEEEIRILVANENKILNCIKML